MITAPLGIAGLGDSEFAWGSAIAVAVLGAFGTGVAFVLMASNAGRYGSTRASSTTYLIPGVSIVLGVVLRDESIEPIALIGSAVALSGAYLVNTAGPGTRYVRHMIPTAAFGSTGHRSTRVYLRGGGARRA